jgi:hypothetical protein
VKTRTLKDVDFDLKVERQFLLDTVKDSRERVKVVDRINKLLDERLKFTEER